MASELDVAFPALTPAEIDDLRPFGAECATTPGEGQFADGDRDFYFFVVLEGSVEIVEHSSGEARQVAMHGEGQFTGDVDMLTGRGVEAQPDPATVYDLVIVGARPSGLAAAAAGGHALRARWRRVDAGTTFACHALDEPSGRVCGRRRSCGLGETRVLRRG